jgi:hypothetical protein
MNTEKEREIKIVEDSVDPRNGQYVSDGVLSGLQCEFTKSAPEFTLQIEY